jgi:NADH-quinone oxidoreductase subunit F
LGCRSSPFTERGITTYFHRMTEKIVLKNIDIPGSETIEVYLSHGGYQALEKALGSFKPAELIEEVKKSGLRGRGGAGFPAGVKWGFVPKQNEKPVYLVCNADEGEPGTFKDRYIIEKDPHLLIEGIIIAGYAIGAHQAYIYIRGEFVKGAGILEKAIGEAYQKGYLGKNILKKGYDLDLHLHRGAGSYVCGEETALLESLEGKRGNPRLKPPFPASVGLFQSPTVINNVETLANIPAIVMKGADWFAGIGKKGNTGTKIFAVSGHVNRPGVYELPLGIPLRELIEQWAGGIREGKRLKAVMPGGSSTPVITAEEIDVDMDFDSLASLGTMLGSGAVIVMDETTCMVRTARRLAGFYAHESCGQCTPCREGVPWMAMILERIEKGEGREQDPDLLLDICDNIKGITLCPLGDAAAMPIESIVKKFREEFEYHIREKRCPSS